MTGLRDLMLACRESGETRELVDAVPYAKFLGFELDCSDEGVIGRMRFSDHLIGNPHLPALHGGTIGALLETSAIFQVLWEAESLQLPKTINITIQFLRSGKAVDTFARTIITKRGRRVVTARAEAWQEDPAQPIAIANAHFLVKPALVD